MERLSNSYQELINQVRREFEIPELKSDESLAIAYSEIPWFPGGQFCISVISSVKTNYSKLIKLEWDNEYDLNRFSSGVYNLDRLCIKRTEIDFSINQQNALENIINSITQFPATLNDNSYIVLDGPDYELMFNIENAKQKYEWKVPTDDIKHVEPLINYLLTIESDK